MFFLLSKLFIFLLRPLTWALLLLLAAVWVKADRWRRRCFWAAFAVLFLFGNGWLFQQVIRQYEYAPVTLEGHYDAAIILGGFLGIPEDSTQQFTEFTEAADRLTAPLELYQQGQLDYLLLTGGSSQVLYTLPSEADIAARYLRAMQLPDSAIVREPRSRNTFENAAFTKELLDSRYPAAKRLLLVTSAWHMPRAKACFDRVGLAVTPYPVDFMRSFSPPTPADILLPNAGTLAAWEKIIKEWVGMAAYWLKGYI